MFFPHAWHWEMVIARIEFSWGSDCTASLISLLVVLPRANVFPPCLAEIWRGAGLGWVFGGYWGFAVRGVPEGMGLGWDYMMVNQTTN